jgi:ABC-type spermidine/putrescine transport system permease subunit I
VSRRGDGRGVRAALLALPSAWAVLFLLGPLALLALMALGSRPPYGGADLDGSGAGISWVAENASLVGRSLGSSVRVAALSTVLALLLATPVAWWASRLSPRARAWVLLLAVLPSWTSLLLRTWAWRFLLGTEGPLNAALGAVGLGAVRWLHTEAAVVAGLAFACFPFAVLPIHAAVSRLDRDVLAAARDLGAGPWRAFWRVGLPLTRAGTVAAAALVFVPSLAAFTVPALLGGADTFLLGQLVQERFLGARDWPSGAAIAVALATVSLLVFLASRREDVRA